jgi:hypothetical protein
MQEPDYYSEGMSTLRQDGTSASIRLGIMLQNNDTSVNDWATFKFFNQTLFNFYVTYLTAFA